MMMCAKTSNGPQNTRNTSRAMRGINNVQYPVALDDIDAIEDRLFLRVNAFPFRDDERRIREPLFISEKAYALQVDLLFWDDLYAWIKDFSFPLRHHQEEQQEVLLQAVSQPLLEKAHTRDSLVGLLGWVWRRSGVHNATWMREVGIQTNTVNFLNYFVILVIYNDVSYLLSSYSHLFLSIWKSATHTICYLRGLGGDPAIQERNVNPSSNATDDNPLSGAQSMLGGLQGDFRFHATAASLWIILWCRLHRNLSQTSPVKRAPMHVLSVWWSMDGNDAQLRCRPFCCDCLFNLCKGVRCDGEHWGRYWEIHPSTEKPNDIFLLLVHF